MYYQPIVNIKTSGSGSRSTAQIEHPDWGISSDDFIYLRESGFIIDIETGC